MRRFPGVALALLGFSSAAIFGLWALVLELRLLYAVWGIVPAVIGFLVLPFTIPLGAIAAGLVYEYWDPLFLVIGVLISAAVGTAGILTWAGRKPSN